MEVVEFAHEDIFFILALTAIEEHLWLFAKLYNLCLESVGKTGTHVVILRVDDFLIRILLSETFSNFLQKGKGNFVLERRVRHADKQQNAIFEDVEVVSIG